MMAGQKIVGTARSLLTRMNAKWKVRCRNGRETAGGRSKTEGEEKRCRHTESDIHCLCDQLLVFHLFFEVAKLHVQSVS